MKPEKLLDKVQDRDSFIALVEALAAEREDAQQIERDNPQAYMCDGAHNWKNAEIGEFLYAALDYFREKPFHKPEKEPSWKMFCEVFVFREDNRIGDDGTNNGMHPARISLGGIR